MSARRFKMKVPRVELNSLEYLCLKMFLNPDQSREWYETGINNYIMGHLNKTFNSEYLFRCTDLFEKWCKPIPNNGWYDCYRVTEKGGQIAKSAAKMIGLKLP